MKHYEISLRHSGSIGNEVKIKKEELYRLYVKELKNQSEIAKLYNCSSTTIHNYLIKFEFQEIMNGYRPNFSIRGDAHPTKRPEVRQKLRDNHYDCSGEKNPNYGSKKMIGSNNPNWQGGIDKSIYPAQWNNRLKRTVLERDKFTCQICKQYPCNNLVVHHKDKNKKNCEESNLVSLCRKCHGLIHHDKLTTNKEL